MFKTLGKSTRMPVATKPTQEVSEKGKLIKDVEISFMSSAEHHEQEEVKKDEESKPQLYGAKILVKQRCILFEKHNSQEPETEANLREQEEAIVEARDFSLPKPSKQSVPEATKVVKTNNVLNEFKLAAPVQLNI